ncbi:hypothetical protein ACU610_24235 [Geodermatophilus sp. URMC 61]|uniref:hypothetical protein n=1 Tax=Geodermatophilus sp. URMC 61 TaxID=3423411 RepID=UPI00406CE9F6
MTTACPGRDDAPSPSRQHSSGQRGRIVGLDVARALTVFGTIGAHLGAVPPDVGPSPAGWPGVVNGRSSTLITTVAATLWRLFLGRGPLERLLTWSSLGAAGRVAPSGTTRTMRSPSCTELCRTCVRARSGTAERAAGTAMTGSTTPSRREAEIAS